MCGKTGYVVQSGNCAASYAEDAQGNGYICVTAGSTSAWRCILDHVAIYYPFLSGKGSAGSASSGGSASTAGSSGDALAQDSMTGTSEEDSFAN